MLVILYLKKTSGCYVNLHDLTDYVGAFCYSNNWY